MDKQYDITGIIKTKQKVKQRCETVTNRYRNKTKTEAEGTQGSD